MLPEKVMNPANVLKALAYMAEGKKLVTRGGIHVIVDDNMMVLYVINNAEYNEVISTKSIHLDFETGIAVMLNTPFIKEKTYSSKDIRQELFD